MGKPKTLSLRERVHLTKLGDTGMFAQKISDQVGVCKTQILSIQRNIWVILQDYEDGVPLAKKCKEKLGTKT